MENRWKYDGTVVVGIGRCVYGIPYYSKCIIKYDPINGTTSIVGEEGDDFFSAKEVLWEEMDVFIRSLEMLAEY